VTLPSLDGLKLTALVATEGVVASYLGEQVALGRRVLIKTLKPNVLPSSPFAAALEREAHLLGEMSHPGVQQLFDYRRNDCQMWLVLESYPGRSLATWLKERPRLEPRRVAALLWLVCSALDHCHKRGIVHRGLSPDQIWITPEGRVILMNFVGAVRERLPTAPELLDGVHHAVVSPYFSPEQVLGEPIDGRSDLFSLGCILYQSVTGKLPFDAADERTISQQIRHDAVPPPSRYLPELPSRLERLIQRCLEKLPADRFAHTTELLAAAEPLLAELDIRTAEAELSQSATEPKCAGAPGRTSTPDAPARARGRLGPLGLGMVGLSAAALLIVLGASLGEHGAALQGSTPRRAAGRLELLPEQAGSLRVVAEPWARVSIDGQLVGTTPLGRPIALSPGTHFVHLEHPRAPIEKRTIRVAPHATILLDVKMSVAPDPKPPGTAAAATLSDSP